MSNSASSRLKSRRHTNNSARNRRVPSLRLHKASGQAYVAWGVQPVGYQASQEPSCLSPAARRHATILSLEATV